MEERRHNFTTTVLWTTVLYYAACGISAIFYPKSWLWVSGLPLEVSNELGLAFGVAGVYLLTMAFAATISAVSPHQHRGLILTLAVGNILDFAVTLKAVVAHSLPFLNGALFIVVTVAFALLLSMAYIKTRLHP